MSPFISIHLLSKVLFPALPGDTDAKLTVQPGGHADAFITDYDGDIPSVYLLKKVGASAFLISRPSGIWEIEAHAIFPNNEYLRH
jgi:hypothetical protein